MKLINITKGMSFNDFREAVMQVLEQSGSVLPVTSSIINWWQHRNFNKRISGNEEKIKNILLSVPEAKTEFIYTKVAPIVFEKIIKEHEDDKVDFLLNGFDNCAKNEVTNFDEILFYFDIISDLRVVELKRFLSFTKLVDEEPLNVGQDEVAKMLLRRADYRLNELGLLYFGIPDGSGGWMRLEHEGQNSTHPLDKSNRASLTATGENVLMFLGYNLKVS